MDEYIGMIKIFCGDFAPRDWEFCHGQVKNISQMRDLFSVIGSYYGGDGKTTFALPNLQTQAPIGYGSRGDLSTYKLGQTGGSPLVALTKDQIPAHNHSFSVNNTSSNIDSPTDLCTIGTPSLQSGRERADTKGYNKQVPGTQLKAASATATTGQGIGHNNMQPYLGVNYIICVRGIFPPHP